MEEIIASQLRQYYSAQASRPTNETGKAVVRWQGWGGGLWGGGYQYYWMLFEGQQEDKGLFTFYREQAQHEDQLKQQRRERRRLRQEQQQQLLLSPELPQNASPTPPPPPPRALKPSPTKLKLPKDPTLQLKPIQPKQRLVESVVDMGKQLQEEADSELLPLGILRSREPSFVSKARKYQQKMDELRLAKLEEGLEPNDMLVESLQRRNHSEEWIQRGKQVIHSARGSVVELPQIRRPEETKAPYRPKKSLKSRLIQEAMHTKDKTKIRQIRQHLRGGSPLLLPLEEDYEEDYEEQEGGQVFELRQKKLLGILKRFRGV